MSEFNQHIIGKIRIVDAGFGEKFSGFIGESTSLKGKDAITQFILTANTVDYSPTDVYFEIIANKTAIFLNYPFWQKHDFSKEGIDAEKCRKAFEFVEKVWSKSFPEIQLGIV